MLHSHFNVDPVDNHIWGHDWPADAELTIKISSGGEEEEFTVMTGEVEWGDSHTFDFYEETLNIEVGDVVTVSYGDVLVRTHTVKYLTVTEIDCEADIVTGTADEDSWVEVEIHTENHDESPRRLVKADGDGNWEADFSKPQEGEGDCPGYELTYEIEPGTHGSAARADEEGNFTRIHWSAPDPRFMVRLNDGGGINGYEWPEETQITVIIEDDEQEQVWDEDEIWTNENGDFDYHIGDEAVVQPGYLVKVSGGGFEKEHVISYLEVTDWDVDADTISGEADPGAEVSVLVHEHEMPHHEWPRREVTADEVSGEWIADFGEVVEGETEPWAEAFSLEPGMWGEAGREDEDGDATVYYWNIPDPHFGVFPAHGMVNGDEWPAEADINVAIDDGNDGYAGTVESEEWGYFEFCTGAFAIEPGYEVTVSAADNGDMIERSHTVTGLTMEIDRDTDTVSGEASVGMPVHVAAFVPFNGYGPPQVAEYIEFEGHEGDWTHTFEGSVKDFEFIIALQVDENGNYTGARKWGEPGDNASLKYFTVGGEDVLELEGIEVEDPEVDEGAELVVEDLEGFAGITAITAEPEASRVVALNGDPVDEGDLADQPLEYGDVIVVAVTAEDGLNVKHYKIEIVLETYTLSLSSLTGKGEVIASYNETDETLSDEDDFVEVYAGTEVTITAEADTGWQFCKWKLDADGETSASIAITVNNNYEFGVTFAFQIADWHHLNNVRKYGVESGDEYEEGSCFILIADLDENTDGYEDHVGTSNGWNPIGGFTGTFDGNGKFISDLFIDRIADSNVGLFGSINEDAEVKNLGLANVYVRASGYVGGLVGKNNGNITHSYVTGDVYGFGHHVGGLVGHNNGEISECFGLATVTAGTYSNNVGGLVGNNGGGNITNCYSAGQVTGGNFNVGGLVGRNFYSPDGTHGTITNSYWDTTASGQESSSGGTGKITYEMTQKNTFINWDFENIWEIEKGETYPFFEWQGNEHIPYAKFEGTVEVQNIISDCANSFEVITSEYKGLTAGYLVVENIDAEKAYVIETAEEGVHTITVDDVERLQEDDIIKVTLYNRENGRELDSDITQVIAFLQTDSINAADATGIAGEEGQIIVTALAEGSPVEGEVISVDDADGLNGLEGTKLTDADGEAVFSFVEEVAGQYTPEFSALNDIINDTADVTIQPNVGASIEVSGQETINIFKETGEHTKYSYSAVVFDEYGNEAEGQGVSWSVEDVNDGNIVSNDHVSIDPATGEVTYSADEITEEDKFTVNATADEYAGVNGSLEVNIINTPHIVLEDWESSGDGVRDITVNEAEGTVEFDYDAGEEFSGKFSFYAVAAKTTAIELDWVYEWNHSYSQAKASVEIYVDGPDGETNEVVVDEEGYIGQVQTRSGDIVLEVTEGYEYGFRIAGEHYDIQQILYGKFTIWEYENYDLTFEVSDEEDQPVSGAVVEVTDEGEKTTGADGEVVFEGLLADNYDYTVFKEGYQQESGSVTIQNSDKTVEVTLFESTYDLTFEVSDEEDQPVSGAVVDVAGVGEKTTGADGVVVFEELKSDTYSYIVSKEGYVDKSGQVEIEGQDKTVTVSWDPAYFEVTNANVDPEEAKVGEEFTVTANIENTGEVTAQQDITLTISDINNDTVIEMEKEDFHVAVGEVETVEFDTTMPYENEFSVGDFTVTIASEDDNATTSLTTIQEIGSIEYADTHTDNQLHFDVKDTNGNPYNFTRGDGELKEDDHDYLASSHAISVDEVIWTYTANGTAIVTYDGLDVGGHNPGSDVIIETLDGSVVSPMYNVQLNTSLNIITGVSQWW